MSYFRRICGSLISYEGKGGNCNLSMLDIVCDNFFALKYFDIHLMAIWLCLNAARLYFSMHGEYNWGDLFVSLESFLYLIIVTFCSSWSNVEWIDNCVMWFSSNNLSYICDLMDYEWMIKHYRFLYFLYEFCKPRFLII